MEDLAQEEEAARMDLVQRTPSGVSRGSERAEGGVLGEEGGVLGEEGVECWGRKVWSSVKL